MKRVIIYLIGVFITFVFLIRCGQPVCVAGFGQCAQMGTSVTPQVGSGTNITVTPPVGVTISRSSGTTYTFTFTGGNGGTGYTFTATSQSPGGTSCGTMVQQGSTAIFTPNPSCASGPCQIYATDNGTPTATTGGGSFNLAN